MNEFGAWDDFIGFVNRAGFAFKNLLGQDKSSPVDIRANGGVQFPATQIASTGANVLDDYEEGTWTPDLRFGNGTTGLTYTTRLGYYTKIGRLVQIEATVTLSAKGSSTGSAVIFGLPFSHPTNSGVSTAAVTWANMTSSLINFTASSYANTSSVVLEGLTAGATTIGTLTDANFANNSSLSFALTYQTST